MVDQIVKDFGKQMEMTGLSLLEQLVLAELQKLVASIIAKNSPLQPLENLPPAAPEQTPPPTT